ncbi:hypothetical protein JOB18_018083 [Solea senegalensis]|uniref:Uncharacterized protein n=1 Tax=Solea senegalensis TaxID=28829 RepID=A0AAV6RB04_SOLSE|nr:hypothetical protein JOB18_018083 [Solea senegalensis]
MSKSGNVQVSCLNHLYMHFLCDFLDNQRSSDRGYKSVPTSNPVECVCESVMYVEEPELQHKGDTSRKKLGSRTGLPKYWTMAGEHQKVQVSQEIRTLLGVSSITAACDATVSKDCFENRFPEGYDAKDQRDG